MPCLRNVTTTRRRRRHDDGHAPARRTRRAPPFSPLHDSTARPRQRSSCAAHPRAQIHRLPPRKLLHLLTFAGDTENTQNRHFRQLKLLPRSSFDFSHVELPHHLPDLPRAPPTSPSTRIAFSTRHRRRHCSVAPPRRGETTPSLFIAHSLLSEDS